MSQRSVRRKKCSQHRYKQSVYLSQLPTIEDDDSSNTTEFSSLGANISSSSTSVNGLDFIPSSNDSSQSSGSFQMNSIQPNVSDYVEAFFSTLLSHVGMTLASCETVINLFKCLMERYSRDPTTLPNVRHFWNKNAKRTIVNVYLLCKRFHSHGPFQGEPGKFSPYQCDNETIPATVKNGYYFLTIPLKEQLEKILPILSESCWIDGESFPDVSNFSQAKAVSQRYDSSRCKRITLTMHSDEIAVGNSSSEKILPVFVSVNSLRHEYRRKFFFLIGLFIGKQKPPVECFLGPLCDELKDISQNPIHWKNAANESFSSIFHLIALIADAPMRAYLRNTKQFNHTNGCDWCLVTATTHERARLYENLSRNRLNDLKREKKDFIDYRNHLMENGTIDYSNGNQRFLGLNGISPLLELEDFDIVQDISVEPMHSITLGVFKNLIMRGFLSSDYSNLYEKNIDKNRFVKILGSRLTDISVPSEFTRIPRDMEQIKYWKSNELDSFLSYFFFTSIYGLLKPRAINNVLVLSRIYYLSHNGSGTFSELEEIKNLVEEFQVGVKILYGPRFLSYNLHILSHLSDSVKNLGPSCNVSSYPLEHFMGYLKKKVHRYSNIPPSLIRFFMADFRFHEIKASKLNKWRLSEKEKKYFGCSQNENLITKIPEKSISNASKTLVIELIQSALDHSPRHHSNFKFFSSIKRDGKRYSTRRYCSRKIRDDSIIKSLDGIFYNIHYIVDHVSQIFFICDSYQTKRVKINLKGFTGNLTFNLENIHEITKKNTQLVALKLESFPTAKIVNLFIVLNHCFYSQKLLNFSSSLSVFLNDLLLSYKLLKI